MTDPNEPIVLHVKAAERPATARRLLEHTLDPHDVASTSDGYVVPRWLAELAGMIVAESPATPAAEAVDAGEDAGSGGDVELDGEQPAAGRRPKKGAGK